jgi:hypothetical protein
MNVQLGQAGSIYSPRVSIINPWYLPGTYLKLIIIIFLLFYCFPQVGSLHKHTTCIYFLFFPFIFYSHFRTGGQTPSDATGTVSVYIPLSRFGILSKFNPIGNLTSINFYADSYGSNYVAYLNDISVGQYAISYLHVLNFFFFFPLLFSLIQYSGSGF